MVNKKTETYHLLEVEKNHPKLINHTHLRSSTYTLIFAISISFVSVFTLCCFLSIATYFKDKFNPDMYNTVIFCVYFGSVTALLIYKQIAERVAAGRLVMSFILGKFDMLSCYFDYWRDHAEKLIFEDFNRIRCRLFCRFEWKPSAMLCYKYLLSIRS